MDYGLSALAIFAGTVVGQVIAFFIVRAISHD